MLDVYQWTHDTVLDVSCVSVDARYSIRC